MIVSVSAVMDDVSDGPPYQEYEEQDNNNEDNPPSEVQGYHDPHTKLEVPLILVAARCDASWRRRTHTCTYEERCARSVPFQNCHQFSHRMRSAKVLELCASQNCYM